METDRAALSGSRPSPGASETLLELARQQALTLIAEAAPLRDILSVLTTAAEAASDNRTVASIMVLDRDGLLRNGASPNLPADYLDAIDRLKPDPDVGTCAAAAATGEIVMRPNFFTDARWSELRHWPSVLGFLSGWSMPIKAPDGRVIGTFGTYMREQGLPTEAERDVVGFLAAIAAQAIAAGNAAQQRQ